MVAPTNGRSPHDPAVSASRRANDYTNRPRPNSRWPGANLFRNPFGELTRGERAELAVVDLEPVVQAVSDADSRDARSPRFRRAAAYQMIGDCGRGKTTRLLAVARRFPTACYVYLPEDEPCPSIPYGQPLLIDEAQRMPAGILRAVLESKTALVVATHRDLSAALQRRGYTVTTEAIGQSLRPEVLAELLNRRIHASRRDRSRPVPQITRAQATSLIERFGTNVRAIEGYLYDRVQSQVNDHGEMRFID
jgi:hypothetical protein